MAFTNEQLERYSRHIILKEVGAKGQKKLLNASVLIIGAGGLGAPAAMYLAAAGVGTIGIADADEVDLSNLQRQVIHTTADLGKAKGPNFLNSFIPGYLSASHLNFPPLISIPLIASLLPLIYLEEE